MRSSRAAPNASRTQPSLAGGAWLVITTLLLGTGCVYEETQDPDFGEEDEDGDDDEDEDGGDDTDAPLGLRTGSVVLDGCSLTAAQRTTLQAMATQAVVADVTLLCLSVTSTGAVEPRESLSQTALNNNAKEISSLGYAVYWGVTAVDENDDPLDAATLGGMLGRAGWRDQTARTLATWAGRAKGLVLDLPQLPDGARANLSMWITGLSGRVRPAGRLMVAVPPVTQSPSDIAGGDAYDLRALSMQVDRIRLRTTDYGTVAEPAAPADSDEAILAYRFAAAQLDGARIDVTVPTYGVDFPPAVMGQTVEEQYLSFAEASALVLQQKATPTRDEAGMLSFQYAQPAGQLHTVFYADKTSITDLLYAWPESVLPASVGVVFSTLGDEDPGVFGEIVSERQP